MDPQHRSALSAGMTPPSASCLDPERLAAWADGGLRPDEIAAIDAHLADCSRCQAVAAMMTTADDGPQRQTAAVVRMPLWRRMHLQWVAPLAAAAALIWAVVPHGTDSTTPSRVDTFARADGAEPSMTSPSPAPSAAESRPAPTPVPAVPPRTSVAETQTRKSASPVESLRDAPMPQQRGASSNSSAADTSTGPDEAPRASSPAPPAAASPSAAATQKSRAPIRETTDTLERTEIGPVAPQPSSATDPVEIRARAADSSASAGAAARSSTPNRAWRLSGARIDILNARGEWERLAASAPAPLVGGDAPSTNVCWIVGRRGVVMRTTDARTFESLPPPALVDLIGVRALDDRQASVTTADGRVFTTTDAGRTWTLRP
jgi:hypothetical protein